MPSLDATNSADLIRDIQRRQAQEECRRAARADRLTEIEAGLRLLHPTPGAVVEIRVLGIPGKGRPYTASGYFDDFAKAAEAVLAYDERGPAGIYQTLNEISPALLSRSPNAMTDYPGHTTTDAEVTRRRWLFIDIDPERPAGVASTETELQSAVDLAYDIEVKLKDSGFADPLIGKSGNGCLLLYAVDLPNTPEITDLIGRFYRGLETQLGTVDPALPYSKLDVAVGNAARIIRVPGSTNRKGVHTPDRPHRRAELFEPVESLGIVPQASIEAVAALAPQPGPLGSKTPYNIPPGSNGNAAKFKRLDVARYLADRGVAFSVKESTGRTIYRVTCPFDPNHGRNSETAVIQNDAGKLTFECKHASCADRRWQDFRMAVGDPAPEHYTGAPTATAVQTPATQAQPAKPTFSVIDSREFAESDFRPRYLVKRILVAEEPAIIGGKYKTLKTSVALDLALSLGTGTPFLGHFEVPQPCNVLVQSGESGPATLQRLAYSIAAERGFTLADASVFWGWKLPQVAILSHQEALCDLIQKRNIDVVLVDPAYLCLLAGDVQGRSASNIFDMGPLLLHLTEIGQLTGSTIILLHHCRKGGPLDTGRPPELEDLAMSGFAEWARQWLLLGRREAYEHGSGLHRLWVNVGGSAGHSGCYAIDVDEGVIDDQFRGKQWAVSVLPPDEARLNAQKRRVEQREGKRQAKVEEYAKRVADVLVKLPDGETGKQLREATGLNGENFGVAVQHLLNGGMIEPCKVSKSGRAYDGFRAIFE